MSERFQLAEDIQVPGLPYRLLAKLGQGAFGQVWKAKHETLPEVYALKFCLDPEALVTLRNEAKHLHRIQRDGPFDGFVRLRQIYDSADREMPFVEYEYVEGEDFEKLLRRRFDEKKPFSPFEAAEVIHSLATIIARIHTLKDPIVHRDLKPSNILVVNGLPPWKFKIADFGLGVVAVSTTRAKNLTVADDGRDLSGGTFSYMSYEQRNPDHKGHPSDDVHALGVIWYELLTGEVATFWSHGPPSHDRQFEWPALRAELVALGLNDAQAALLESCLKRHDARPRNAEIMAEKIYELFPPLRESIQKDAAELQRIRALGEDWLAHLLKVVKDRIIVWNDGVKAGIAEACWLNGFLWENAINTPDKKTDLSTARKLFQAAADEGFANAQYELALYCKHGIGGKKDIEQAAVLLKQAADQGHRDAQYELGLCYLHENAGGESSRANAIEMLNRAAHQSHADAWLHLGALLSEGKEDDLRLLNSFSRVEEK